MCTRARVAPKKREAPDGRASVGASGRTRRYLLSRAKQYHRRYLLDDRVRNGNGYGQVPVGHRENSVEREYPRATGRGVAESRHPVDERASRLDLEER